MPLTVCLYVHIGKKREYVEITPYTTGHCGIYRKKALQHYKPQK